MTADYMLRAKALESRLKEIGVSQGMLAGGYQAAIDQQVGTTESQWRKEVRNQLRGSMSVGGRTEALKLIGGTVVSVGPLTRVPDSTLKSILHADLERVQNEANRQTLTASRYALPGTLVRESPQTVAAPQIVAPTRIDALKPVPIGPTPLPPATPEPLRPAPATEEWAPTFPGTDMFAPGGGAPAAPPAYYPPEMDEPGPVAPTAPVKQGIQPWHIGVGIGAVVVVGTIFLLVKRQKKQKKKR